MISTIADAALSLSRWIELSLLAKATVMLAVGLTAARMAPNARASVRHLLLAATFGTLIVLPLAVVSVPGVVIQVPLASSSTFVTPGGAEPSTDGSVARASTANQGGTLEDRGRTARFWPSVVRWGWVVGSAALLASLAVALWRLGRIRRTGLPRPDLRQLV